MNDKRQEYIDIRKRFLEERNNYPIVVAFNDDELEKALKKLNATREEVCTLYGIGDIIRKADVPKLRETHKRQRDELLTKLMTDPKFAEEAFLYEMDNHEYCINMTGDIDVLQCFGIPYDEHEGACLDDLGLDGAYLRARRRHMDKAHENGII